VTRVCVVSGAARGIGLATMRLFGERGYSCVGIDIDADAIASAQGTLGEDASFVEADLLAGDSIDLPLPEGGPLELTLVNNMGGSTSHRTMSPLEPGPWDDFAATLEFNLRPLHVLTQACVSTMRENGSGRIVNVASVAARRQSPVVGPAYEAAKAAVVALSRRLAGELARDGILVNTVCPGVIATERIEANWGLRDDATNERFLRGIPLGRLGRPEEVAEAIWFLGSVSTYTTGAIVDINGGIHLP
jgi:3-oxoacyl-[acyl-carrier protein] reductase